MPPRLSQIAGTNAERTKAHNRRVILGYVQQSGGAGRAEIARASGLSTQTVSNLIAELEQDGLVVAAGRRPSARGQPPVIYAFNPAGAAALGFEVRPDALVAALTDLAGGSCGRHKNPCPLPTQTPFSTGWPIWPPRHVLLALSLCLGLDWFCPAPLVSKG